MAEGKSDRIRWIIGALLTAIGLVFGSSLYDRFTRRHLTFDLQPIPFPTGKAVLTLANTSDRSCDSTTITFKANATLSTAKIRNPKPDASVVVAGKTVTVDGARLPAAGHGQVTIDFDYADLRSPILVLTPVSPTVGCGEMSFQLRPYTDATTSNTGLWILLGGLGILAFAALVVGKLAVNPFNKWF
jgi:hypothetical protein